MANSVTKFSARHATIKFNTATTTWDLATNLDDETWATTLASAKDVTITPPKSEVEKVDLLGTTAQTIGAGVIIGGTFQNQILDEKSWSTGKVTGTLVLTGDEQLDIAALGAGYATSGTNTSTRYGFGDLASGKERTKVGSVLITLHNNLTDSSGEVVSFAMQNPIFMLGEIKPTSAEGGHWECGFEIEALPNDCAWEFQD